MSFLLELNKRKSIAIFILKHGHLNNVVSIA
jgi:hypothetical protein